MALGPVFRHEMLAAGRKRRFFLASFGVGLGMLLLMWACVSGASYDDGELSISDSARLTATFYATFVWSTLIGVLIATPVVVAGAIASERERRTIEYLFATDLSNSEIVLDKLAARLLTVGKLVLAAVPVLAIFRLMGGVPGQLLLLHFALIASTALVCAAIALVVSVWCDRARDAVPRAGGWVFLWMITTPIFWAVVGSFLSSHNPDVAWWGEKVLTPAAMFWSMGNPIFVLVVAGGLAGRAVGIDAHPEWIGWMVLGHVVAASLLTGLAVMMVRRVHLSALSAGARTGKRKRVDRRVARRRSPGEDRPMLWKEMHAASVRPAKRAWVKRIGVVLLVALIATPLAMSLYYVDSYDDYSTTSLPLASICGALVALAAGSRAAGLVCYEHERETWLSLLTTDLSAREIVHGKLWGNLWAMRWQLLGCIAIVFSSVLIDILEPLTWSFGGEKYRLYGVRALVATSGYALVLGLVAIAATAIGLAVSLRVKSSTKAVGGTIGILLAIGGLYPMVMMFLLAIGGTHEEAAYAVLAMPPCAPFIMVVPGWLMNQYGPGDAFIVSLVFGVLFYAFLAITTTVANISAFDRLCGRSTIDNLGDPVVAPRTAPS